MTMKETICVAISISNVFQFCGCLGIGFGLCPAESGHFAGADQAGQCEAVEYGVLLAP